ncbi:integrase [Pandoraea apista]|uniref:Integrase n=1 Tax=Pandoraea apista TaxID=93218 RepID=A0ABX9ZJ58_9BURK|nr:tyrosine-type recombinase/integrase [Pandoraea apista]RSK75884.1 integrase [Pandoraea apista]RUN80206.1 integrase [Pandoraea apista]
MNARRRKTPDGLPSRVYVKHGSYYWFKPGTNRWVRLCRVGDGEAAMLERLANEKRKAESATGSGNIPGLVDDYVDQHKKKHKEKAWPHYAEYVKSSFRDVDVDQVDPAYVVEFLTTNWDGKLHMQRVMRAFLSGFFAWCILKRHMTSNPCREVKLKKPKARDVYITDGHFIAIRDALAKEANGREVRSGEMMQCFVDLCYLTMQRSTDVRNLMWADVDREAKVIHFQPSKTADSTGEAVDWPITPEIDAVLERARTFGKVKGKHVIHSLSGKPYGATAVRSAWDRACVRAGLGEAVYTVKDIRAKAMTDAERAGYTMEQLRVAAAHSDVKTTEIYLKSRLTPTSVIRMNLPKAG